jgi:hypothetical protein
MSPGQIYAALRKLTLNVNLEEDARSKLFSYIETCVVGK